MTRGRRPASPHRGSALVAVRVIVSLVAACIVLTLGPTTGHADDTWTAIRPGVDLLYRTTTAPARQQIHAVRVDLTRPEVSIRASRDALRSERGVTTSTFARSVGALAAINADWTSGSTPIGVAVGDGAQWSEQHEPHGWGVFGCDIFNRCDAMILPARADAGWFEPTLFPWRLDNLVGGNGVPLIVDGVRGGGCYEPACGASGCRNPRSAICIDEPGTTLWMIAVDGRRTSAQGMTCDEMRDLVIDLGCHDALMLDGGGSTSLFVDGSVRNRPSGGSERSVANHIGVIYTPSVDARCTGGASRSWCDGTVIRTCSGGRFVGEGDCGAFGVPCQEDGDQAFCVHPDCPGGDGMAGTCAGSVVTGCADGTPRTADCAAAGLACRATGDRAQCVAPACECVPGARATGACGSCGERSRVCGDDCRWRAWSACSGEGVCAPGATESEACGVCGARERRCSDTCTWGGWGPCSDDATCEPGATESRPCGRCGTQQRTCSAECGWGEWTPCTGEGACDPGAVEEAACCDCGAQSRQCGDTCAWTDWTPCRTIDDFAPTGCDTGLGGACASGQTACEDGCLTCAPTAEPSSEVCNGRDDDCNGSVDEGAPLLVGDDRPSIAARVTDVAFASVVGTDRVLRGAVQFENVGTDAWPAGTLALVLDADDPARWYVDGAWPSNEHVARNPSDVAPGQSARFDVQLRIPDVDIDAAPRLVLTDDGGMPVACPDPDVELATWVRIPERPSDDTGGTPVDAGPDDATSTDSGTSDAHTSSGPTTRSSGGCALVSHTPARVPRGPLVVLVALLVVRRRR